MKNKNTILAAALVITVGVAGYGLYRAGMSQGMKMATLMASTGEPSDANGGKVNTNKKVLYWHDPMVPGQKFDKPGKSPFMNMQLVPVYADNDGDAGTVKINPNLQQNLGIRTAEVTRASLSSAVTAVGSVAYNERDVALVQARSNGFVERLYVRAPLDAVRKGQALAELYVPDWVAAQEEYLTVKRMRGTGMDVLVDGARQRMQLAGMDDAQIRLIESSGKVHPRITVTAPIGGVVSELTVREGMTVMAGTPLFKINGIATIWLNADVPENVAAQVRPGNPVEARTPALRGKVFKGKVGAILPEVNATTRTLKARIELANPSGELVPGMFATLNFAPTSRHDVLLVPSEAVIRTGTRSVVMVEQGTSGFVPVDVEVGVESNGKTEILKGLDAGKKVVVSGQFLIDSEASLKGAGDRMNDIPAPGKAAPAHHGQGKVEKIGKEDITISHGPIPTLQWGPMTMEFSLPASGLPRNVVVGDTVAFDIQATPDGQFRITVISPVAEAPMQSGMPMANPPGAAK